MCLDLLNSLGGELWEILKGFDWVVLFLFPISSFRKPVFSFCYSSFKNFAPRVSCLESLKLWVTILCFTAENCAWVHHEV